MIRLLVLLLAVPCPAMQSEEPREVLKGVKAPAGFEVTLFAAPPKVAYPTCLSCGPNGEVFVGVDENGSIDAKPGRGRVLRCIDTDGDGRADEINVFATMDSPRGIVWDAGTLYVQHPPFVSAFIDDDGDGKADRSEVLVKGLGFDLKFRGADHTTNGMRLGIDGWLYIAVGDYGCIKAVGKDGTEVQLHGGGVMRVRTDGSGLEIYSRGQRNIYDVAVDPFLNAFTRDNTNDGGGWDVRLSHVVPSANFGYPSLFQHFGEEIVQPLADSGGGAPCGSLYLDEPGLGSALYTCEWGRSAVHRHPLVANGATFKAKQEPFLEIPRPTDIDVDGQSRLNVSSWKNGNFTYSGPNVGYVARISPAGLKPAPTRDLKKSTDEALVQDLASPSAVWRLAIQREILRRGDKPGFASGLSKLALSDAPLAGRVAAIFTLLQLQGPRSHETLVKFLDHAELREFALRALADRRGPMPSDVITRFFRDSNPRVRLQAAVAVARLQKKEAASELTGLLADPDPIVAHVAVNSLVSLHAVDECFVALEAGTPNAVRVLQSIHEMPVVDGLLSRLVKVQGPAARKPLLAALCRLYTQEAKWDGKWWGTRPDTTGPYFNPVKWEGSERIARVLASELGAGTETTRWLLTELQRNRVDLPEAAALVLKEAANDPSFRPVAVNLLAARSPIPDEAVELFVAVAVSEKEPSALRAKAIRALLKLKSPPLDAIARGLEKPDGDLQPVWEEFVRDARHAQNVDFFVKLAGERREVAFGVLAKLSAGKSEARAAAFQAVDRAWTQPDALVPLLRAVGRARVDAYAHQVSSFAKDTRPDVKKAAAWAADQLGLNKVSQGTPIEKLPYEQVVAEAVKEKGDAKHGATLYQRQGCAACHTVSPDEPPKGPFLGGIATRYSRAELVESILKPSAKIAQGFETQAFKLSSDDVVEGFVSRESGDEVEVRNVQGTAAVLKKKDIVARVKRETSVMPTGLADRLTTGDLASLLAYLESLKSK
jgi:putative heme-binding domain-containing protein